MLNLFRETSFCLFGLVKYSGRKELSTRTTCVSGHSCDEVFDRDCATAIAR